MAISIKNLQYLLAVQQHLHFSKAAEACFVSQSTLSAGINKLEHSLNVQLIERTNKSVVLTPLGVRLSKQAEKVVSSVHDFNKLARLDFYESAITIGIIPTIAPYVLPKFISDIKHQHPKLEVTIVEDISDNLLHKIEVLEIDLGILALPFKEFDVVEQHVMFEDNLVLVQHKNRGSAEIRQGDLLLLEQGHCLREHILNYASLHHEQISASSCTTLDTLIAMIDMEMGVSFLPQMAIDSGILEARPNLVVHPTHEEIKRGIGVIYRKHNPWHERILALAELLKPVG